MAISKSTTRSNLKRCSKCGFTCDYAVANTYFGVNKWGKDGLRSQCKICICAKDKIYHNENRERILSHMAKYRAEHKEERAAQQAIYYAKNKSKIATRIAADRKANKAKFSARHVAYYEANKEQISAKAVEYRKTEKGIRSEKAKHQNRRLRKKMNGGRLTAADISLILKAHTDKKGRLRCARCGKVIKGKYHLDHFIPLSRGGSNDPGNFRVMHPKCNQNKFTKMPEEIGMLI